MAISWCIFNKSAGNKMTTGGSGMELKTEILIIGGGASGMAAACVIREIGRAHV